MQLEPGATLGKGIRLVRPLGRGGMGTVWVAAHAALNTEVAVKVLSDRLLQDERSVARFAAEAAAAAKIRSPHVVHVLDHGVEDKVPYIVMELLEGEDLAARLARVGKLSPAETRRIVRHTCAALEKAHGLGIVHRDIKPSNLFLTDVAGETFVKVLDFGLAKVETASDMSSTGSGAVFGTPQYMSPEQAQSAKNATARSDLWSLAVVVYQCLTGEPPFVADTLMGLCIAISEGRFSTPSSLDPALPTSFDAWFARAVARDPEARFPSARELANALDTALGVTTVPEPAPRMPSKSASDASLEAAPTVAAPAVPPSVAARSRRALLAGVAAVAVAGGLAFYASTRGAPAPLAERETADPVAARSNESPTPLAAPPSASSSAAPLPAAPAGPPPPAAAHTVELVSTVTNDLFTIDHFRAVAGSAPLVACYSFPTHDELKAHMFEMFDLGVSKDGAVTSVQRLGSSPAPPAFVSCAANALRALRFGPTQTGGPGTVRAGYRAY